MENGDMKTFIVDVLKELSEAHGVAGSERTVRSVFCQHVSGEFVGDRLGGGFVRREGSENAPKILVCGHFDEVGFAVQSFTSEGFIRFSALGGVWPHVVPGNRVRILTDSGKEVVGVIGAKPPHFLSDEERGKLLSLEQMFIDVGARDREDVSQRLGIRLGDTIVFDSPFANLTNSELLVGKAFDNRVGVALAVAAARNLGDGNHPNTVFCGATVQEEVGGRGAAAVARLLDPDVVIVLEGTPADDMPGSAPDTRQGALGKGVQIRLQDPSAIMNRPLVDFIRHVAEEEGIDHQLAVRRSGGTDAKYFQAHGLGVPTAVLGVPVRYPHTANGVVDAEDCVKSLDLLLAVLNRLDSNVAQSFVPCSA